MTANLNYENFSLINPDDPFFDSLKGDYKEFPSWFRSKASDFAYTARTNGRLDGFLYLKREEGGVEDVDPPLPSARRLKIGTFKIVPHGTRLGERFVKKAFDHALDAKVSQIYVTVFPQYTVLTQLLGRYGFAAIGKKRSSNGEENVLCRDLTRVTGDVVKDYPRIPVQQDRHFLLSLYPDWHSRLLPDSILKNEDTTILSDISHTNSIHKIYLAAMKGLEHLRRGDTLVIYRTNDGAGHAYYRSVATSVCVVEELRHISEFTSLEHFLQYCEPYSIFTRTELTGFYSRKRYPWIIRFTYNLALRRRVTRQVLIEDVGLNRDSYWGFLQLSTKQFKQILMCAGHAEDTLVH